MKEYNYCPICGTPLQIGMIEGRRKLEQCLTPYTKWQSYTYNATGYV